MPEPAARAGQRTFTEVFRLLVQDPVQILHMHTDERVCFVYLRYLHRVVILPVNKDNCSDKHAVFFNGLWTSNLKTSVSKFSRL